MRNILTINSFFDQVFEKHINEDMLELNYVFPTEKLLEYIDNLCSIPYEDFLNYLIEKGKFKPILAGDITQNSNIDDCHINLCNALSEAGDPGMDFNAIGRVLQNDGVDRAPGADKKYGENHIKTASQLGLAWELCGTWYLTCIGRVFCLLSQETQSAIMARCLLRSPFYARVLCNAIKTDIHLPEYMSILSVSTIKRRLPSVKKMLEIVIRANSNSDILIARLDNAIKEKCEVKNKKTDTLDNLPPMSLVADDN